MNRKTCIRMVLLLCVLFSISMLCFQSFGGESPAEAGKTHYFKATHYYNTFSFAHPPALRIKPGDRVVTKTVDCHGWDETKTQVCPGGNPQIGPFYVEGAEPGDVLIVRLEKIKPNRETAWTSQALSSYVLDPGFLRAKALRGPRSRQIWQVDISKGTARTTFDNIQPSCIEVPLQPMLGCVAVAPGRKEAVRTSTPANFGGNMDYPGVKEGAILMFPVYEPGALLFLGDGHALQGHGEVLGNGLETSMDVEFSVDLIKNKKIGWPRLENDDYIMVIGSARPLLQALQHASTELLLWLMNDYGFDERGASLLMGAALEYDIANVVDPNFTVVAKIKKELLPGCK